jgi:hypothetical protein
MALCRILSNTGAARRGWHRNLSQVGRVKTETRTASVGNSGNSVFGHEPDSPLGKVALENANIVS